MDIKNTVLNVERIFDANDGTKFQLEHCKPKVVKASIVETIKYDFGKKPEFYHFDAKTQKIYVVKPIRK